jgi:Predicted membrane protein
MSTTQRDLASLSRYIFRAPRWYVSLGFAVGIAALTGIAGFDSGGYSVGWQGLFVIGRDAWEGVFFIGLPTVLAAVLTTTVDRRLGGLLTTNRSFLLALVAELVVVAIVVTAGGVAAVSSLSQRFIFDALIFGLASIFALRLLVVMAVSRSSLVIAAIPAAIQPALAAVLLFVYSGTLRYLEVGGPLANAYILPLFARPAAGPPALSALTSDHFVLLTITTVLYGLGVYAFIIIVDRPWRRSMGVSSLDFLRGFIGHIAEGSDELEEFFEAIGEEAIVPVSVVSVRTEDGEKARVVLPMIHPGPMGEIGGGNLPERVAATAEGMAFAPHATAGHDFNLVTHREVDAILAAVDRIMDRLTYTTEATPSVRIDSGEVSMLGQAVGDHALLMSTFAPAFADDIDFGVGLSAVAEARRAGLDTVLLVDAHNSNHGVSDHPIEHVTPGSPRGFDLISAAGLLGDRLSAAERSKISVGVGWDRTPWTLTEGIGPLGIRTMVMAVDGQLTGYSLVDGNNMEPGLRDALRERLLQMTELDEYEIATTDTHVVNTVTANNQVGAAIDQDRLLSVIAGTVDAAHADLEPVSVGVGVEQATVTVFGNDRTETLASHANAMITMGGALAVSVIIAATAVSMLIFLFA